MDGRSLARMLLVLCHALHLALLRKLCLGLVWALTTPATRSMSQLRSKVLLGCTSEMHFATPWPGRSLSVGVWV